MNKNEVIEIGNRCVHCRRDTSLGSGNFVNRYPVFGLYNEELKREEDGYCCDECEQKWCDENEKNYRVKVVVTEIHYINIIAVDEESAKDKAETDGVEAINAHTTNVEAVSALEVSYD